MMRMAHIVTEIRNFDNKRNKVTLDYGEVTFLLVRLAAHVSNGLKSRIHPVVGRI